MNTKTKSVLAASVAASLGGVAGQADAAVYIATLTQVVSYSNNGSSAGNITSSTATFSYDDVTNLLTQTGGTFNVRFTTSPSSTLFRQSITGLVIGNGAAASASAYTCTEGNFGGNVGASICGNYNFGSNSINDSTVTWGPGITFDRTVGGDDMTLGAQQSIAAYDAFTETSLDPLTTLVLSNATCTAGCLTQAGGSFNGGYRWTLGSLTLAGTVDDTVNAQAGVASSVSVLANDVGYPNPVTVTIESPPDQGGTAVVVGSPGVASGISITYTPSGAFSGTETFQYRAVGGGVDDVGTVTATVAAGPDLTPDAFTFASQTGVGVSSQVTSAAAVIGGITAATPISITGGTYSIDGGAYTAVAGTVTNGQSVTVRQTSSANPATDTVTTLTIGGVDGTFTSTTEAADTTPNAFTFAPQTGVAKSSTITSAAAVIGGINTASPISVTGGTYSINGGAYTAANGTVTNGQSVTVRLTSSDQPTTDATATLTIGGVSADFTATTRSNSNGGSSAVDGLILGALGLLGLARRRNRR